MPLPDKIQSSSSPLFTPFQVRNLVERALNEAMKHGYNLSDLCLAGILDILDDLLSSAGLENDPTPRS